MKLGGKRLEKLNSYTESTPAFRANLKIKNQEGGFSSYQSEYPFSMVTKKYNIFIKFFDKYRC